MLVLPPALAPSPLLTAPLAVLLMPPEVTLVTGLILDQQPAYLAGDRVDSGVVVSNVPLEDTRMNGLVIAFPALAQFWRLARSAIKRRAPFVRVSNVHSNGVLGAEHPSAVRTLRVLRLVLLVDLPLVAAKGVGGFEGFVAEVAGEGALACMRAVDVGLEAFSPAEGQRAGVAAQHVRASVEEMVLQES